MSSNFDTQNQKASCAPFLGLDLISTAVLVVDPALHLRYANAAAESLFAFSFKSTDSRALTTLFPRNSALFSMLNQALIRTVGLVEHDLHIELPGNISHRLMCVATPIEQADAMLVLEFRKVEQQLKIAREEQILEHQQLNRTLIRNLAHEIKNPLGGIRGSAQLLERELPSNELREYTQVIVKEADRLQSLMDRLLAPSRLPQRVATNIHEVLERVRTLILAEYPQGILVQRDYDTSLPELIGDKEQLIQAILNITRNAAQAMKGAGKIILCTRIARQITLGRHRYKHALLIKIIDNGPGVPTALKDSVFYPLVSGREDGSGLGLSLAQEFINQHQGIIEFESEPGRTSFDIVLPIIEDGVTSLQR